MIWLVLLLALILRLINLDQSLWWDEAINIVYAKTSSFWWFITKYPIGDFHPPGYFVILWLWGHIFGFSEFMIRLPSVIFGVGTVYFTYLLGRELFNKKIGLLAALFLAIAPLHIYYSQEARMYSLAAFVVTLSSYFLIKFIENQKFAFLGLAFSIFLILYSDYLAYFILPAHFIFIYFYHKKLIRRYLLSVFLGILSLIPWMLIFPEQLRNGVEKSSLILGWRNVVGGAGIKEVILLPVKILIGRVTFDNKLLYTSIVIIASIPYIFSFKKLTAKLEERVNFLLLLIIIPMLLAFIFSFFIPIFSYFRFLFILPALYLLVAYGLEKYKFPLNILLISLVIFFEIFASALYLLNSKFHREDWKGMVNFIGQNSDTKSVLLHKNNEIPAAFIYYNFDQTNTIAAFHNIPVRSGTDLIDLSHQLAPYNKIFLVDYLVDITDPNRLLENKLEEIGFKKISTYDFRGVGFVYQYEAIK